MFASDVCEVVGNLFFTGKRASHVISADRRETGSVRKVDGGKTPVSWVIGNIHILEPQLGNCGGSFNGEIRRQESLRKSESELIEQVGPDRVVVRNQETSVVLVVQVVGQKRVYNIGHQVLPVETCIDLLFRVDNLINPPIHSIRAGRYGLQVLVVETAGRSQLSYAIHIRQRIIIVQQGQRGRIQI